MHERDDDDLRLPSAAVLETWTVPEAGDELADRIADAWRDERASRAGTRPRRRPGSVVGVVLGAAVGAAAAIVVMLLLRPPVADPPSPAPAVAPTAPVPVAAPAPAPMPVPDAEELAKMKADVERIARDLDARETMRDEFLLVLDVEPDDARVQVTMSGRTVADVVGDARLLLPREPYDMVVEAAGHEPKTLSGDPAEAGEIEQAVRLTLVPRARPERADLFRKVFGGKRAPKASAPSSGDLKNPFSRDDDPVKSARLRIGTKSGVGLARVYVDGTLVGTTPIVAYPVTPGRHEVRWHWDDGRTVERTVDLDADEVRVLKAD